ncbi:transcriptional enhancer factor TEF-1-like isoform X2 [Phycodurus eques]|uniref:transcriptional enhancer factor TEF-1-like isoform X2 n=1 Tax=Phycodurus eques TaxID=693459 RepID=UPI002ACE77B5|nr:transcriptional enhancer factor TEF-1-like isoform X2 [Phycodurus eques]
MERSSWSGSESPGDDIDRLSDSGGDKTMDGDPEGVWSPDIEQSFQEALAIYPPCGRRKIILSDEGKMYGRNELIARYIKLRTGKTRTRKQVSSHIQVLARRKSREFQSKIKDHNAKEKALQSISSMSSSQIVSATAIHSKLLPGIVRANFAGNTQLWQGMIPGGQSSSASEDIKPFSQQAYSVQTAGTTTITGYERPAAESHREPAWQGRSIGTTKLRLVEFSSFLETQREQEAYNKHLFVHINQSNPSYSDPLLECVDIRQIYDKFPEKKGGLKELFAKGPQNAFYLIKFWTEYARFENGRFVYRISRSPMCEYMINFIHKLKHLPEKYMMNSVLENFTILLVVSNRDTQETLLCMACVFEVSNNEHGAQHHIYRLIKE